MILRLIQAGAFIVLHHERSSSHGSCVARPSCLKSPVEGRVYKTLFPRRYPCFASMVTRENWTKLEVPHSIPATARSALKSEGLHVEYDSPCRRFLVR